MKKTITFLIITALCMPVFAQQFSFQLYFESAQGEKDTLVLGYDPLATQSIDETFGEVDYKTPRSPDKFQAFIIHRFYYSTNWGEEFYLKKQIVPVTEGHMESHAIPIILPYESLPVKVNWEKSLFDYPERDHSLITDWAVDLWFDSGYCTFKEYLKDSDTLIIGEPYEGMSKIEHTFSDEEGSITFRTFYVAFGKEENDGVSIHHPSADLAITTYPNPVQDVFFINNSSGKQIKQTRLFSYEGKKVKTVDGNIDSVDCSELPSGIYILQIETTDGIQYHKLIKTNTL
ncbi:MAG: T9SS type A sorting domain-containing protein [Bacteroidales bacterium]|nr:T9SS type A sorting domain-containing protein [Bacteroidales bacterium]